jgi:hypothetical protein
VDLVAHHVAQRLVHHPLTVEPGLSFERRTFDIDRKMRFAAAIIAGMDAEEIFDAQHPVRGWDSSRRIYDGGAGAQPAWADFTDPLDAIGARFASLKTATNTHGRTISRADQNALKTLGLGDDAAQSVGRADIRRAYSALVRKYHPDRNGGNRSHEKQLAKVIEAYTQLKESPDFR